MNKDIIEHILSFLNISDLLKLKTLSKNIDIKVLIEEKLRQDSFLRFWYNIKPKKK